jgi:hypothetical protein
MSTLWRPANAVRRDLKGLDGNGRNVDTPSR